MCELYSGVDPQMFEHQTRSIRMEGVVTSIRLERIFWQILERIAAEENLRLSTFLSRIYHERLARFTDIDNFSSLLRVACTTYLNNKQRVEMDVDADALKAG
jgi:predicted DNA-binding ribbon-helix-helix protein